MVVTTFQVQISQYCLVMRSNERNISNQETFFRNLKKELCLFFCPDPLIIFKSHPSHLDVECAFWHFFYFFYFFTFFTFSAFLTKQPARPQKPLVMAPPYFFDFFFLSIFSCFSFLSCMFFYLSFVFSLYFMFFLSVLCFFHSQKNP